MKLIRFGAAGAEKPGVILDDGLRIDVSEFGRDYNELFFGGNGVAELRVWLAANARKAPRVDPSVRLRLPHRAPK